MVRSSSPSSQSQTLIVVSSEPDASEENIGWKATHVIGYRWDWSVCRAGARGSQLAGSWFLRRSEVGVVESSSLWRLEFRCSRSSTYACEQGIHGYRCRKCTFFCNRTTLVHFFSSNPSYFFRVASSKLGDTLTSSRNAAAVFGALMTPRYAIIALCLPTCRQCYAGEAAPGALTALPLAVRSISHSWRRCVLMWIAGGGAHRP